MADPSLKDPDYYEYESESYINVQFLLYRLTMKEWVYISPSFFRTAHILFDDTMELNDDEEFVPNQFVKQLVDVVDEAGRWVTLTFGMRRPCLPVNPGTLCQSKSSFVNKQSCLPSNVGVVQSPSFDAVLPVQ